jgi:hypothetical protein
MVEMELSLHLSRWQPPQDSKSSPKEGMRLMLLSLRGQRST